MLDRRFLFLQGPHGPFFDRLADSLRAAGAETWRVGFNAGDRAFWRDRTRYIGYSGTPEAWGDEFDAICRGRAVTDLVVYGCARPVHAEAIARAEAAGRRVHVFEEGYLRPYWVTYERGGTNGHSRLLDIPVAAMARALGPDAPAAPAAPDRWGDLREHVFYGALYHFHVLLRNRDASRFPPHRGISVRREFGLYLRRLVTLPVTAAHRMLATRRIARGGFPYHLALLQLEHDSSFRSHGPYRTMAAFLEDCIAGFARGAPGHHHLVFKAHPLEDGRARLPATIRRIARRHGVRDRIHYVAGGKLARLLDGAAGAVTVTSTAGQQALWRGLPLAAVGRAVYAKPALASSQPLAAFFAAPQPPDPRAYRIYRRYLLATSQVPGGFYSARGRRRLLRRMTDLLLAEADPYDSLPPAAAAPQQLRAVG